VTELLILTHKTLGHLAVVMAGAGIFTAIDFNHTVTLGSVLIAVVLAAIAGLFTIRSKIANIWRQEAEGERARADRLQEELTEEKASRALFEREQQELRHDLKDQLAQCKAQLKVMEAKTDLTVALEAIKALNEHTTESIVSAMHRTSLLSEQRDNKTQELLEAIRDKLPSEPIAVDLVHEEQSG
jgi:hypothetical protein